MHRDHRWTCVAALIGSLCVANPTRADEFAFSSYGLGAAAFGAGVTPPAGTYISFVSAYYEGDIRGPVTIGGIIIDAGMRVGFFSQAVNALYVPERKVMGGSLGASITVPLGHIDIDAQVTGPLGNTIERSVDGWGLGDVSGRLQLGWAPRQDFAHLIYVQAVAPTGRYSPNGLQPNIGLNRPGIDTGWAVTWTEPTSKLQFNAAVGITFNFENEDTNYQSGTDFHFEWAVGYEIRQGLLIGPAGYHYRQLTGDSGPGAFLGPFEGEVDAIGGGISYTTLVGTTPLVMNARYYQEFNPEHRMEGSTTFVSATVRF